MPHKTTKILYLSPLHQNNNGRPEISQSGAFGVKTLYDLMRNLILKEKNKSGTWFSVNWFYKQEIFKNITLENRFSLYSDIYK
jgi:hypothetical protein